MVAGYLRQSRTKQEIIRLNYSGRWFVFELITPKVMESQTMPSRRVEALRIFPVRVCGGNLLS